MTVRGPAIVALACLALAAACTEPPRPVPPLDERHVITVEGTTVRYNGRVLDWSADAKRWEEVLGPASREWNGISVWNDLGVIVHHNHGTPEPHAFVVLLGRTRHSASTKTEPEFWPRSTFRGRLTVDGALVHPGSTIQEIHREKKGTPFRRAYRPTIYNYFQDDFRIGLDFGHDGTLTYFSIGPAITEKAPAERGSR